MLSSHPAVFIIGNTYQIMIKTDYECLMWIKVGNEYYYDEVNGIMRSKVPVHKITVPCDVLNREKNYTLYVKKIIDRQPYFPKSEETKEYEYDFRPVTGEHIRAYHISDAHNLVSQPIKAAKAFGDMDFLILNGDIISSADSPENYNNIYIICSELAKGSIPIVFSRGNHDLRGPFAEKMAEYTPSDSGKSYYSFRLGCIWGIVLDCGEDKPDEHEEYGNTVCCHQYREKETEFIRKVINSKRFEYEDDGVCIKLVISHTPFTEILEPPFDIENDVYNEWCMLMREHIKPDIMICGHIHALKINEPEGEKDHRGQSCRVVIGSDMKNSNYFAGCGIEFHKDSAVITFTDSNKKVIDSKRIDYGK